MDAKLVRLIAGGGHDAALSIAANGYRQPAETWVIPLFDGRVESVHVDVDDAPHFRRLDGHTKVSNRV
jgi:hypothetical protein